MRERKIVFAVESAEKYTYQLQSNRAPWIKGDENLFTILK